MKTLRLRQGESGWAHAEEVPVIAAAVLGLLLPGSAAALPGQHGSDEGHLLGTGDWGKIEYVGQLEVTQTEGLVADVAAYGNYAYLANWGEPDCAGPEKGGQNTPTPAPG